MEKFVLGSGLEDVGVTVFAQCEDFAVVSPGRSGEGCVPFGPDALLFVDLLSRFCVVAAQETEVKEDIEVVTVKQWRGVIRCGERLGPGDELVAGFIFFKTDVTGSTWFDREDRADFVTDITRTNVEKTVA